MHRLALPLLIALVGTSALAADAPENDRDTARLEKALAGLTPGKPTDCISQVRARDSQRFGDKILYAYSPREKYLVDTGGGCFGLRRGDAIITKTTTSQLCRGDIVRTVDLASRIPSGSCSFGDFTPYTR